MECKVSIIVPVYNVEQYLETCMDSLVHQTLKEIEIIAVNDGSPDNCLEILNNYQNLYPQKVKVFTTENRGVSHARNYGLDHAKGTYVQFVDSDDFIALDMSEKLYQKAIQDQNDIVLCSRYSVHQDKKKGKTDQKAIKLGLISQNFNVQNQPFEYAHISPFPWDKLFLREFIGKDRFPENIRFEDLVFVYRLCCHAKNIGFLNQPLYYYRKTTKTGFLNTFSDSTLDIIKAFDLLFQYLQENHYLELLREETAYICIRHFLLRYPALFQNKTRGKLPLKLQLIEGTQNFLDEKFPDWRNNHYLLYTASPEITKYISLYTNKKKLIHKVKHQERLPKKWIVLKKTLRKKRKLRKKKWKKFFKRIGVKISKLFKLPPQYRYTKYFLGQPVSENKILLESKHGEDIAGNIFSILQELTTSPHYQHFQIYLVIKEKKRELFETLLNNYNIRNYTFLIYRTSDYLSLLASAKYLITDTSFPPYFIKKSKQIYLNTWHGTPLKAMGRIVPNREYALGNVQRNFLIADYLLYQNEFSRDAFLNDYMIKNLYKGKIFLSGYPRNTAFFHPERASQIRKECGTSDLQVIVYMPTWRGLLTNKESKKQLALLHKYFLELDTLLTENQIFYVKLHPYVKNKINYENYFYIKPFPEQYETYDFLNASDLLVTDYSSILFDYAVSRKKIILFTYDQEEYLKDRGMYLDITKLELPLVQTVEELVLEMKDTTCHYENFYHTYCSFDHKDCTKNICKALFLGQATEQLRIEEPKQERENILIYIKRLPKEKKLAKFIQSFDALDTQKYNYYISFPSKKWKKDTAALSYLKKEIGYLPLLPGYNTTVSEKISSILFVKFGVRTSYTTKKFEALTKRERKKHYGKTKFIFLFTYANWSDWMKSRLM